MMQAFQTLRASRPFLPASNSDCNQVRAKAAEQGPLDCPACDMPTGTVTLADAVGDHRGACIRAFASRRFAPALARITSALTRIRTAFAPAFWTRVRVEDVVASQYAGRCWCDATEREIISDISSWRATRF